MENKEPLQGLIVEPVDKDYKCDDRLGSVITDQDGKFEIFYDEVDFKDAYLDTKPDLYLRIKNPDGNIIHTTEDQVRYKADKVEEFVVDIPERSIKRMENIMPKNADEINNSYEKRYAEEANLKKKLILDDVEQWIGKMASQKRDEPYLIMGVHSYTPNQLLEEVKKDTDIGRMVTRTLDKGRLELSKKRRGL
ncbi:MAG: hypothetical protein K0A89_09365 [ANME-2 cluster archaeon]|nr:hypothetical protein [ANME-2 cluster archaeon]